jgi:uncharacterized protein YjbJ (UPF0337 family)
MDGFRPYSKAPERIRVERHFVYPSRKPMGEIIDKVKGKIKQAAGNVSGDKKLEREGKVDEAKGKVKGAVEDLKHAAKSAVRKP